MPFEIAQIRWHFSLGKFGHFPLVFHLTKWIPHMLTLHESLFYTHQSTPPQGLDPKGCFINLNNLTMRFR